MPHNVVRLSRGVWMRDCVTFANAVGSNRRLGSPVPETFDASHCGPFELQPVDVRK